MQSYRDDFFVWEQCKLGDVCEEVSGNNGNIKGLPILTISAANGWMNQKDRFSQVIAGNELKKYTLLEKGHLAYNHGNSKLAKYGTVFVQNLYDQALVPRVYHSFKMKSENNPYYVEYYFATKKLDRELARLVTSGARMDGLLNINKKDFFKIKFEVPTPVEQSLISTIFQKLDQTITLHEEKKRQLERLKSALLQKMFANKSGYPAVRFNGFEKVWNERRIGDVLFKKSAKNTDLQFDKTDILSVSSMSDMETSREINSSESYMKTYNKLLVGELAFEGHSSAKYPFGRFVINNYRDGIVSHIYDVYKFKEDMNIHFVAEFFKQKKTMYYPLVNSTTAARMMNSLVAKDFYKQQIRFPTLEEQDQIGKLIKEIDFICIQHDRKIKLMKRVKRSLLQMMFI